MNTTERLKQMVEQYCPPLSVGDHTLLTALEHQLASQKAQIEQLKCELNRQRAATYSDAYRLRREQASSALNVISVPNDFWFFGPPGLSQAGGYFKVLVCTGKIMLYKLDGNAYVRCPALRPEEVPIYHGAL